MSFNQMNEQFNDAFETIFPEKGFLGRYGMKMLTVFIRFLMMVRVGIWGGKSFINERIVEYPQIFQLLKPSGTVLDIGCVTSRLPIQLASLGYRVYGLDTRSYSFTHPNFHFYKGDIFTWEPDVKFDIILLISTLEHFGLGGYGDITMKDADKIAIQKISKWLSPGGQLLVTLPFGKAGITTKHRIYDSARIKYVFSGFTPAFQGYFMRVNGNWQPSSAEELKDIASLAMPVNGVAIMDFRIK